MRGCVYACVDLKNRRVSPRIGKRIMRGEEKRREEKKRNPIGSKIKKTSTALPFSMTEVGYSIS